MGEPTGIKGVPPRIPSVAPQGISQEIPKGSPHGRAEICIHDFWRLVKGWFRGSIVGVVEGLVGGRGGRGRRRVPVGGGASGGVLGFFFWDILGGMSLWVLE